MPAQSGGAQKSQVSAPMTAVVVIILIAFIGWLGYRSFAPPPHPVLPDNVQTPIAKWIRSKAKESGGDITKLSPEDQQKLQTVTQGKGVAYLKKYVNSP